jgi:acyl-CoA reductase-like NAD-dependent aldehyde dehydrogenase
MSTILYPPPSSGSSDTSRGNSSSLGNMASPQSGPTAFHLYSCATDEIYLTRAYATMQEVKDTLRQARDAFPVWKGLSLEERCKILSKSLEYFRNHEKELAEELVHLIGRPIKSTPREIQGYVARCEYMVKIAPQALAPLEFQELCSLSVEKSATDHESSAAEINTASSPYCIDRSTTRDALIRKRVTHEPLGIVFVVSAWNFPYLIAAKAVIPALLAGNVVILKPSTQAPTIAEHMVQSCINAGMPKGVFQYIHTSHSGTETLLRHRLTSYVHYTGSVEGGRSISAAISDKFTDSTLELGGCDAAYVRYDADLDMAALELVDGAFFNSGQCCCGVQRIFIHADVYDKFVELFKKQTLLQYGQVGNPLLPQTTLGPCIKSTAADTIRELIEEDIQNGAISLLSSSDAPSIPDYDTLLTQRNSPYLPPIILTNTTQDMQVQKEELFGPVVSLTKVLSDQEAISKMNDNPYGLTASIWTRDSKLVSEFFGPELQVGTVYQNKCDLLDPSLPWTCMKRSGKGVAMSTWGFSAITRTKSFYLRETNANV